MSDLALGDPAVAASVVVGPSHSAFERLRSALRQAAAPERVGYALIGSDLVAVASVVATAVALHCRLLRIVAPLVPQPTFGALLVSCAEPVAAAYALAAIAFAWRGHFSERYGAWRETRDVFAAAFIAAASGVLLALPDGLGADGRIALAIGTPVAITVARLVSKRVLTALGVWQIPVLVVGDAEGMEAARCLFTIGDPPGHRIAGELTVASGGAVPPWTGLLAAHGARKLVFAFARDDAARRSLARSAARERVAFALLDDGDDLPLRCERTSFFAHEAGLLNYRVRASRSAARGVKIVIDWCFAATLLALLAPFMAAVALLIRRDRGGALFTQERLGEGGRRFRCLKFRTMVADGDALLRAHLERDPGAAAEWAATRKLRDDPRVTTIGRFLRKTSLDELPQLINVVRGEMSIVGPRPIVQAETGRYAEDIGFYYGCRPGLTGLWQVNGRSNTTYERRVQLDRWYVRNWSLAYDLAILAKTLPAVLWARGAH